MSQDGYSGVGPARSSGRLPPAAARQARPSGSSEAASDLTRRRGMGFSFLRARSVLDDDGDVAPADLRDVGAIAATGLDHADRIAVPVLGGDGPMSAAELGDAGDIAAPELACVSAVPATLLTDDDAIAPARLRADRIVAEAVLIDGQAVAASVL